MVSVVVLAVGGVITFRILDERREPVALPLGVVVDRATCLAPEVLAAAIPVPVQPPGFVVGSFTSCGHGS